MLMMRAARKAKGLTMKELGKLVGVSESAISQYETGKREMDYETLLKIGEVLECSADYLLRGEKQKKPTPVSGDGLSEERKAWSIAWDQASPELRRAAMAVLRSGEPNPEAPGASPSDT